MHWDLNLIWFRVNELLNEQVGGKKLIDSNGYQTPKSSPYSPPHALHSLGSPEAGIPIKGDALSKRKGGRAPLSLQALCSQPSICRRVAHVKCLMAGQGSLSRNQHRVPLWGGHNPL